MKGTMDAISKTHAGGGAELVHTAIPKIGSSDVLIKIKATSICGTDVHIFDWTDWAKSRMDPPTIFGHECCGEIVEVGKSVESVGLGDFVSTETHVADWTCEQCRTGHAHICENLKLIGVDRPGVFAEYAAVPASAVWVNDPKMDPVVATTQEPLGNAVHTVFKGDVVGKTVGVFGLGPIGICAALVSKHAGAERVIATETMGYRIKLAEKLGVETTINPLDSDPVKEISSLTGGRGIDVLLEMSGSEKALLSGLRALRPGGRASILGLYSKPVTMDVNELIVTKDVTINGIYGRIMWDTWYKVASLLRSKAIDLEQLVTHQFHGLSKFDEAMKTMKSRRSGKIVVFP
jgi:threonine 3-dehydrogenase